MQENFVPTWLLRIWKCHPVLPITKQSLQEFVLYENGKLDYPPCASTQNLIDAKRWFEWTINEYANLYGTQEWPGWLQLEKDFQDDPKMVVWGKPY